MIKIFVIFLFFITIIAIIAGGWSLSNIKEGMRKPLYEGQWNIDEIEKNYKLLNLKEYEIPQSSSLTAFAESCVANGPPDIATLLIIGDSNKYVAYYSDVAIDPSTKYNKSKSGQPSTTPESPTEVVQKSSSAPLALSPIPIDNNKYSSAACVSSKVDPKKITDTPLILGDLITDKGSNYRITGIVDKSNSNNISGTYSIYVFGNESFESSLAGAAENDNRFDTNPDDGLSIKTIVNTSPSKIKLNPNNTIASVDDWNPSGYFLRVTKEEDAAPLPPVNVSGDIRAKSLLNFNNEVKYAPAFGDGIGSLLNWVKNGKKPCDLYGDPPGNYNAYELFKYVYNKAEPKAKTQINSNYPELKFLWDSTQDVPSAEVLDAIKSNLPGNK